MTMEFETKPRVRGKPKQIPRKCLVPTCNGLFPTPDANSVGGRGLCCDCYKKAHQLVKRKFTTWEELEYLELAEPKYASVMERAIILARKAKQQEEGEVRKQADKDEAWKE